MILQGETTTELESDMQQQLIKHLQSRTDVEKLPAEITINDWIGKMKTWPESTSTSPSGFHLSHSKALIAKVDIEDEEERAAFGNKRETIIRWQVSLLNLAIQHKYSLHRWQAIVNVMI